MKGLSIIPARSGSRSVPDKNIRSFSNSSLLEEAIKHVLKTNLDLDIVVSTDSEEYALKARNAGAFVNTLRPENLATDQIDLTMTLQFEYMNAVKLLNKKYDYILLTLPTSPFRKIKNTINCVNYFLKMRDQGVTSTLTVFESEANENPAWQIRLDQNNFDLVPKLENIFRDNINQFPPNRASLPKFYIKNDHAIVIDFNNIICDKPSIYGEKPLVYICKKYYDIDINSIEEFKIAEKLYLGVS